MNELSKVLMIKSAIKHDLVKGMILHPNHTEPDVAKRYVEEVLRFEAELKTIVSRETAMSDAEIMNITLAMSSEVLDEGQEQRQGSFLSGVNFGAMLMAKKLLK